jgi:hypothetical protein
MSIVNATLHTAKKLGTEIKKGVDAVHLRGGAPFCSATLENRTSGVDGLHDHDEDLHANYAPGEWGFDKLTPTPKQIGCMKRGT